jgi:PAS domain S-box-containing protein
MTHWPRVGFSLAIALLLPVALLAQNARNVLVLQEGYPDQPGSIRFSEGLHEVFDPSLRNQIYNEYLDEDRLHVEDATLAEMLRQKYEGKKFDLVVGAGRPALTFLLSHRDELWPGTPEIFIFVDRRLLPAQLPPNATAIALTADSETTLDLAVQLMPNTRRVFYVGGTSLSDKARRFLAEQDFKRFAGGIEFTYLTDLPLVDLLERLGRLPDGSIVIYGSMEQDASGHAYIAARVCGFVASASNVPVYSSYDTFVGSGIVGGRILDFKDLGAQTARLALRVLDRGGASGLPVETWPSHAVVDWRQLERWHIPESRVPKDAVVLFREPGIWERYRWYILGAASILLLQSVMIAALVVQARRRKLAEYAMTASAAQLRHFLKAAPIGLTRCSRDLRFLSANSGYAEIVGLPVDKIIGRPIIDVLGTDGWETIRPYVEGVLRGERVEYETALVYPAAGSRLIHVVYMPEKEGEKVIGWVASITDITEFKRIEKQLQVEKLEKMAAAGQLAASLAHEINNPLEAVSNVLYLLAGRSDLDPASAGLISIANKEIARVARIVRQSLSYYRAGTLAREVDLAALLEESLQVFSDKFQRAGVAVSKKIKPETSIVGFADEIRQVVDNLLVNAVEATPLGGHLTVCLRPSRSWKDLSELGARLTIADSGSGISKAYLARVFEPFFTTKDEKGTGLGLWVVKGLVEKRGGSVKIRSTDALARSGTVVSIFWLQAGTVAHPTFLKRTSRSPH